MASLRAHPNSLQAMVTRGPWIPVLNLCWLFYVVFAAVALPLSLPEKAFTWASLVAFLPLYYGAWRDNMARLPWYTLAIAVLGLASVWINTVFSFLIYAAAFVVFCGSRRQGLIGLAALLLSFCAVAAFSPRFNVFGMVFCVGICLVVAFFNVQYRNAAQADAGLRLSHEEVRRLAASAERERIGRDLHDSLGATLALIAVKSELAGRLLERDVNAARAQVADIEQVAREALTQVRAAVAGIRSALLAGELASARLLLETAGVAFAADVDSLPLSPEVESALALGLREAATNVQRHARAKAVRVTLRVDADRALMVIEDDGIGASLRKGHGLTGMEERLGAVGGSVEIATVRQGSSRGTRLSLRVPLPKTQEMETGAAASAPMVLGARPA
ncbi:MAG: sensor histidine kinase [Paucibacter sp.]|nr:sensor histidine kinase [Roseateles sp.]